MTLMCGISRLTMADNADSIPTGYKMKAITVIKVIDEQLQIFTFMNEMKDSNAHEW